MYLVVLPLDGAFTKPHLKVTAFKVGLFVLQRYISRIRFSFIVEFKHSLVLLQLFYSFVYYDVL